jgi:hypothetical protein
VPPGLLSFFSVEKEMAAAHSGLPQLHCRAADPSRVTAASGWSAHRGAESAGRRRQAIVIRRGWQNGSPSAAAI